MAARWLAAGAAVLLLARMAARWLAAGAAVLLLAAPRIAAAQLTPQSVVGSPHDLSVTGPGRVHALFEEQVCIFCHAPHNATGQAPLWNRTMPPMHYRVYQSSTTDARINQPSGPSKMCLSCHDGALALGLIASRPPNDPIVMSQRTIPPGRTDLTQDLSDDHPIGFRFDRALLARDPQLKNPDLLTRTLPLGRHNEVHCTTCHDPHNNTLGNFLREPQLRSTICLSCHDMKGWRTSSHAISAARVTGRSVDPREVLPYHTVADNGCTNCHKIHGAEGRERLLRFRREEDNCLNCHSGGVAKSNIASQIHKTSAHPVWLFSARHDPKEDPRVMSRHVECADCHNPHAATTDVFKTFQRPTFGMIDTSELFVPGITRVGRATELARFEYEVCFKCHSESITRPRVGKIVRQVLQTNTRLEFQPTNPSFHPIVGPRNNPDVVSLKLPWKSGSMVKCTDCHNSDEAGRDPIVGGVTMGSGSRGPHGSIYAPILIDQYLTADFTLESPRAYALCYRCHDRANLLGDNSFPLHSEHVVRGRVPCSACHDSHGVSRAQGNSTNHSNLINFDLSIVRQAGASSQILFDDRGQRRGSCTLSCHGVVHVNFEYGG